MSESRDDTDIAFGETVYDAEANELGRIRQFDEHGFYVTLEEGIEGLSEEHVVSGGAFGEAELMWRCWDCGEMGQLDEGMPAECPNCGAPKEEIYYWTED